MEGVKLEGDRITIHGTSYTRAEFRAKLQEIVEAMQSDPASAYRDRKNPDHQQTVEEVALAYKFLNNELSPQDETEIVQEWHAAEEVTEVANPFDELRELYHDQTYLRAKEILREIGGRAKLNQPEFSRERAALAREDEINRAIKAAEPKRQDRDYAGNPKSPGGRMPDTSRYISTTTRELSKLPPVEQAHRSRELIANIRADKSHPYNLPNDPRHKQAVAEVQMLYQGQYYEGDGKPIIENEEPK